MPAFGDTDLFQHNGAIRRHCRALAMKALDLALAPLDRVVATAFASVLAHGTDDEPQSTHGTKRKLDISGDGALWFDGHMAKQLYRAIGLMSGTSLDGIDVAFIESDGENEVATGPWLTMPYEREFREALRGTLGGKGPVAEIERALTEAHAAAVKRLVERHELAGVEL